MNTPAFHTLRSGLIALAAVLTLGSASAEKPEWAGNGKHGRADMSERGPRHDRGADRRDREDRKHDRKRDRDHDKHRDRAEHGQRGHWEAERYRDRDDDRERRHAHERRERERDRDRHERYRAPAVVIHPGGYFNDGHRRHARDWYGQQIRTGHCPPGLAKKHNGCMPPGQARKWAVGRPLPAGVAYYAVPQPVLMQLGPAPAGYRYGRVANDIVLMPMGSRLVVDAIIDLGQLF